MKLWNLILAIGWLLPTWILKQCKGHCSVDCQILQREKGGKIVSTVKVVQGRTTSGHFMNLINGQIIDRQGNVWKGDQAIGSIGNFGNGSYIIVEIKDDFKSFGIHSIKGLIEYTKRKHNEFCS